MLKPNFLKIWGTQLKSAIAKLFVKMFDEQNVATAAINDAVSEDYSKASTSFFETHHFLEKYFTSAYWKSVSSQINIIGENSKNATQEW